MPIQAQFKAFNPSLTVVSRQNLGILKISKTCNRTKFNYSIDNNYIPMGGWVLKGSLKEALKGAKEHHLPENISLFTFKFNNDWLYDLYIWKKLNLDLSIVFEILKIHKLGFNSMAHEGLKS